MVAWVPIAMAAYSAYSAYQQNRAQKKAAGAQAPMPMFGAPRLAPGVYRAAQASAPPPMMPNVGADMGAQPPGPPEIDAEELLRQMTAPRGSGYG